MKSDSVRAFVPRRLSGSPRHRDGAVFLLLFLVSAALLLAVAPAELLSRHTPFNHFAHLAEGWINGELHLADGPPSYAQNNDFAKYKGRWFITFPPFPAVLLLPFVWLGGSAESVRDGQIFLWIAALVPSWMFLALQQLSLGGHSQRDTRSNALLSLCLGFGTVFFFSSVQGTVWFAAHVVGVVLCAVYLFAAIDGRRPVLAGTALGLALLTRAPMVFAAVFFGLEAWKTSLGPAGSVAGGASRTLRAYCARVDWRSFMLRVSLFSLPVLGCLCINFWHNSARFEGIFDSGYKYLTVAWQQRMNKWGLFHYHYLPKNLGVMLTSLPWIGERALFRINAHGLALWFTTPVYFWLLWPARHKAIHRNLWLTVVVIALPTLFYQNTGWAQFGYRFSNDYVVFLFALLAVGGRRFGKGFVLAAAFGVAVNAFGAASFNRKEFRAYYYQQASQERLYQKD